MKVSVIIPVYNEEKYIKNCLMSLSKQTKKAHEVIIIDNNCTDKTIQIAKKYNVKIIQEHKQGITPARNRGFEEATGDILARCDADSILPKNWIRRITDNFTRQKIDAITGPSDFYDLNIPGYSTLLIAYLEFFKTIKNHHTLRGPNMAITKSIWEKVKKNTCLDDKKIHEDMDLSIHIHKIKGSIHIDKKLIVMISGRRAKSNPISYFGEYPLRLIKTLQNH